MRGVRAEALADAGPQLASLADETPEGRSIVVLAKEKYGIRGRDMGGLNATFVPFTAQSRISGVDLDGSSIRKGAVDSILAYVGANVGRGRPRARSPSARRSTLTRLRESRRSPRRSLSSAAAARPLRSPVTVVCSASSISRTS